MRVETACQLGGSEEIKKKVPYFLHSGNIYDPFLSLFITCEVIFIWSNFFFGGGGEANPLLPKKKTSPWNFSFICNFFIYFLVLKQ